MRARCRRWLVLFRCEFCGNAVNPGLPFGELAIVGWLRLAKLCRVPIGDAAGLKVAKCGFNFGQAVDHAEPAAAEVGRSFDRAKLAKFVSLSQASELIELCLSKRLGLGIGISNVPQLETALIGIAEERLVPD